MKALLIWPKFDSYSFWNFEPVCEISGVRYMTPPLGIMTVAALLPKEWDMRVIDENVELVDEDDMKWAEVVLIGCKIVQRKRSFEIIRMAKEHNLPVAVGGPDVTLTHDSYDGSGVDYVFLGEGELTVPDWLRDLENGVKRGVYQAKGSADITKTPIPRFDLVDYSNYLYAGLQYSRGCPYKCDFCNVIDIFEEYHTKTSPQMLAELDALYAAGYRGHIALFDDNFIGHLNKVKPFLRDLEQWLIKHKYPFQFSTSVTLNLSKDDELMDLLRRTRFKSFLVGIETPDEDVLRQAQKGQNLGISIAEATDRIYRMTGATIHSGFLLGMDEEPDDICKQIIDCIEETSVPWVMAGVVYPLPGTKFSRRLDETGRLFPTARTDLSGDDTRDQISAGIQFRTHRPPADVLKDLLHILDYSYDPKRYFERCADVAVRLNTQSNPLMSWALLYRNMKIGLRLFVNVTFSSSKRTPFWKAFWKVLFKNRAGIEALMTLAVLSVHFEKMIPYSVKILKGQIKEIEDMGEDAWYAERLDESKCKSSAKLRERHGDVTTTETPPTITA